MKPLFGKVGVFGVGLLGGSVALGIKERFLAEEVHAYDQDPMALEKALFLGVADRVHTVVSKASNTLDRLLDEIQAVRPLRGARLTPP